jgi:predicted DCC family thiol-disulfide oxidoreductase YuxK
MTHTPDKQIPTVTLLYDHTCPFCRREALWLKRRDRNDALVLEDISGNQFDATRYGLTQEIVDGTIHALLPDGRVVTGMEVFRQIYSAVGLGWVMAATGWPLLRPIFDAAYRLFARHRVRLGALTGRDCAADSCRTGY